MRGLERQGIVLRDGLSFIEVRVGGRLERVRIAGRVECAAGVTVYVRTVLDARTRRDGRAEVRGAFCAWHAWREAGGRTRSLLRYDSSPFEALHRHVFDPATGADIGKVPVRREDMPDLDQAIRLAADLGARLAGG